MVKILHKMHNFCLKFKKKLGKGLSKVPSPDRTFYPSAPLLPSSGSAAGA